MLEGKLAYWNLSENSISVSSGRNGSWESFVSWYLPKGSFLDLRTDVLGGGKEGGMGEGGGRRMQVVFVVNSFLCD